jgi:serine/threonine protein phosphatase PrpC
MEQQLPMRDAISVWLLRTAAVSAARYVPQIFSVIGSARGRVRSENQDKVLGVAFYPQNLDQAFHAFVVCDGLGGMESGEQCAALCASVFVTELVASAGQADRVVRLRKAVERANSEVLRVYRERGGTTLSAILVEPHGATAVAVGDTRIYSHGEKGELSQVSRDDTIGEQIAALKQDNLNRIDKSLAKQLSQAIGQSNSINPQIYDVSSSVLPSAAKTATRSRLGLLVTTDGIHGLGSYVLDRISRGAGSARELVHRLTTVSDWMGGFDNASAIYIAPQESLDKKSGKPLVGHGLHLFDSSGELLIVNVVRESSANYVLPSALEYAAPVRELLRQRDKRKLPGKGKKKVKRGAGKKTRGSNKNKESMQPELDIKVTQRSG